MWQAPSAAESQTTKATSRSFPEGTEGHRATSVKTACLTSSPTPLLEQQSTNLGRKEPFRQPPFKCPQVTPHCHSVCTVHTHHHIRNRPNSLLPRPASLSTNSNTLPHYFVSNFMCSFLKIPRVYRACIGVVLTVGT